MLINPIYIDLEGADLTGKSTLLKTTFRESDYSKIMCFHDRGILTHYLYNMCFYRFPEDHGMWLIEVYKFVQENGMVILYAGVDTIKSRFKERSDDLFKLKSIIKMNELYRRFYEDHLYNFDTVTLINTDNKTPKQIFEEAEFLYIHMLRKGQDEKSIPNGRKGFHS